MKVMKIIAKPGADTPSRCVPFLPVFPYKNTLMSSYINVMMLKLIYECDITNVIVSFWDNLNY